MPIIGNVGRRSLGVRLLNIFIHFLLIAGGITMVYPFLIMFSGSAKYERDAKYLDIIPRYLRDEAILFQKHIRTKYNNSLGLAQEVLRERLISFEELQPPRDFPPPAGRGLGGLPQGPSPGDGPFLLWAGGGERTWG